MIRGSEARETRGKQDDSGATSDPFIILKGGIRDSAWPGGCWKQEDVSRILPTLGSGFPSLGCGFPSLTAACAIHGAAYSPLQVCLAAAGAAHGSPCGCYVCPFVPPRDPFVA